MVIDLKNYLTESEIINIALDLSLDIKVTEIPNLLKFVTKIIETNYKLAESLNSVTIKTNDLILARVKSKLQLTEISFLINFHKDREHSCFITGDCLDADCHKTRKDYFKNLYVANQQKHEWVCTSPGAYDSHYKCSICTKQHRVSIDSPETALPEFGCSVTS